MSIPKAEGKRTQPACSTCEEHNHAVFANCSISLSAIGARRNRNLPNFAFRAWLCHTTLPTTDSEKRCLASACSTRNGHTRAACLEGGRATLVSRARHHGRENSNIESTYREHCPRVLWLSPSHQSPITKDFEGSSFRRNITSHSELKCDRGWIQKMAQKESSGKGAQSEAIEAKFRAKRERWNKNTRHTVQELYCQSYNPWDEIDHFRCP